MLQVRAASLTCYEGVAKVLGIDAFALLKSHGINCSKLADPELHLPATRMVALLEESARVSGVDSFGLQVASCWTFANVGPVSILLQHLPTLRDVVLAFQEFQHTHSDVVTVSLEESSGIATVRIDMVPEAFGAQATDLHLGLAAIVLTGAAGGRWMPETVHFAHSQPRDLDTFRRFFRANLEFDSHFSGFSLEGHRLDLPLPLADRAMAAHARTLVSQLYRPSPLCIHQRVRQAIVLLLPSGQATLANVASNLDVSPRALQRHLASKGHNFATILNDVRKELAKSYLSNTARTLTDVAEDLGYAQQSAFTRWFSQEFGFSPSKWRHGEIAATRH